MEILKYPVGRFEAPESISPALREEWIATLEKFPGMLKDTVAGWTDAQFNTSYREGSWSVRKLIHHIADSHMNAMRRFKLGLTENNPKIKTYDQDGWASLADYSQIEAQVSLDLIEGIHKRLCCILRSLDDTEFKRTIFHPEMNKSISLEKLLALYDWHSRHHLAQIVQLKKAEAW